MSLDCSPSQYDLGPTKVPDSRFSFFRHIYTPCDDG